MRGVLLALATALLFVAGTAWAGDVYVRGYYRSDGTYVKPHYRSAPDGNVLNNWWTKGNFKPHTGRSGVKNPYNLGQGNSGYGSGESLLTPRSTFGGGSNSGSSRSSATDGLAVAAGESAAG